MIHIFKRNLFSLVLRERYLVPSGSKTSSIFENVCGKYVILGVEKDSGLILGEKLLKLSISLS